MSLDIRLGQRQEQRAALLPQMLQSIEVLQLATEDLLQFLEQEVEANETLELRPASAPEPEMNQAPAEREDSSWEEWRRGPAGDGEDKKQAFLENVPAGETTLVDFVGQQLAFRSVPPVLASAVLALTAHLDDRGLLPFSIETLAKEVDMAAELLHEAHDVLRTLEPCGIGAFDPVEAMLLQAQDDPDLDSIEQLLHSHLEALSRNKLPEVARAMDLPLEELHALLLRMRELNPHPGAEFSGRPGVPLRPDAYAWLRDGVVQTALDDAWMPDLRINTEYETMAGDGTTPREVRDYLRRKLRSARDLIEAVHNRQHTMLRVVQAVMREQAAFLAKGRIAIRPLRMSEIADRLQMHTSTVSRAIAGKHVQTDRGVFRLRDFFDGGRIDAEPAAGQGRMAVAQQIADIVAAEDKQTPLSDDDLVAALAGRGVQAARRTITKYRKELGIPSSYLRRRFDPS
ncbi:MAG TPA: RNA polymerase factor sigma-54 [Planctomycetota bacterium]|nr:RNA polymerase factor sigma-54 [Planctomycetota bacterium]